MGANYDDEMPLVTIVMHGMQEVRGSIPLSSTSVALLLLSLMSRLV